MNGCFRPDVLGTCSFRGRTALDGDDQQEICNSRTLLEQKKPGAQMWLEGDARMAGGGSRATCGNMCFASISILSGSATVAAVQCLM